MSQTAKPDGRRPGRPDHYPGRYEVVVSRTPGKWGCFDIALIKKSTAGVPFKQGVEIVRAWRSRSGAGVFGSPHDLALQEAHALREELDASLRH